MSTPVAIVGIGCRFPGADDAGQYWQLLRDGADATSGLPADRASYRQKGVLGRIVPRGGFVHGIEDFDPYFFGLSPREAIGLDPQTRLLLETAWRAAEDAGITSRDLCGVRTGVFVGLCSDDYNQLIRDRAPDIEFQAAFGASRSSGSGRISYCLGLTGPSVTLDSACSSSLVSVHLAVRAIQNGDCELALAGGANLLLAPETTTSFMRGGLLSPAGRCEAFREGANGFVRSEGAGIVLLKPLDKALADEDRVYAVIRGSSVNNDGRDSLYMAPSVPGQTRVIRAACADSGLSPLDVQYVEAHGTGTRIGDPVEVDALSIALCDGRPADRPLRIGSCKANIGHLEAGAGAAGLIKAALALHHGELPPSIHSDPLNADIPWDDRHIRVQRRLEPWPDQGGPRVAGVNSFGITGTNAHLVLTDVPAKAARGAHQPRLRLLPLSARDPVSLRQLAAEWPSVLASPAARLDDLCHTAGTRRTHYDHRLVIVGRSAVEMAGRLAAWAQDAAAEGIVSSHVTPAGRTAPLFVYSGIGSQWPRMGLELYDDVPVFRDAFDRVSALFEEHSGIRLMEEVRREPDASHIDRVEVMQPALFALQVALTALWRSWGVQPAAVVGHSLGEAAAAWAAGALSLEDAVLYVHVRSECLARTEDVGGMLALGVTPAQAQIAIRGLENRVAVGVVTARDSVVLSGDRTALDDIEARYRDTDVFCRRVKASVATHSPLMDPFLPEIAARIQRLVPREAHVPFYSTVTGTKLDGLALTPAYWVRNVRECVRFAPAMEAMLGDGARSFVEISAHPLLLQPMQRAAADRSIDALVVPTLRRQADSEAAMLEALGRLHAAGYDVDWRALMEPDARHTDVPPHPFRRERFWVQDVPPRAYAEHVFSRLTRPKAHALLPIRCDAADKPGAATWFVTLDPRNHPFLMQHIVGTVATLPFTTYIEMAFAAGIEILGPGPKVLRDVRFLKGQFLAPGGTLTFQLVVTPASGESYAVSFYSNSDSSGSWELCCQARLSHDSLNSADPPVGLDEARTRFPTPVSTERLLEIQELHGFSYGPLYRALSEARRGSKEYLARVTYLPELKRELGFHLHPAFLDGFLQLPFINHTTDETPAFRLPVAIDEISLRELPDDTTFFGYGRTETGDGVERYAMQLLSEEGQPLITVRGLLAREFEPAAAAASAAPPWTRWMYETVWEPTDPVPGGAPGSWTIVSHDARAAALLSADLEAAGHICSIVAARDVNAEVVATMGGAAPIPWSGLIYLLPRGERADEAEDAGREFQRTVCGGLLDLLQSSAARDWSEPPRIFVVSRGAFAVVQGDRPVPALAPAIGLARVAANEFPPFRIVAVDLDGLDGDEATFGPLSGELCAEWAGESDVAFRSGARYVRRLTRKDAAGLPRRTRRIQVGDELPASSRIVSPSPGVLENISLELAARRPPAAGEVEIRVVAGGLNFLDVLRSLRLGPLQDQGPATFGLECSGVVVRVGEGITSVRPGQYVVALAAATEGCFQTYATLPERFVFAIPHHIGLKSAATWLVAYQTAWYALNELGRLRRGESILIHAAAGGVGLAAVHIARHLGCEVYATAGSEEKRDFLRQLGASHVMNSRTLDFAEQIQELTGGRGVDAVLNSIAGEAIPKSLSALAMGGRFLEIGKRDIYANSKLDLLPFRRNLSYYAIDMLGLTIECEARVLRVTREVVDMLAQGVLPSLPYTEFSSEDAPHAFRHMAQSRHIGKVLITFETPGLDVEVADRDVVRATGSYLITGGLTGLGLLCAEWLVARGARSLILAGRREPDAAAQAIIQTLRDAGAEVLTAQVDVGRADEVAALVRPWTSRSAARPLAGVIHAAGVIRDGLIPNLDWARIDTALAPKVYGTRNLLAALDRHRLDFFVLFSSIASSLASPGQANYAAANAYLDAVGDAARADDPAMLCINWGPWTGLGMLETEGLRPAPMFGPDGIRAGEGLAALELLLSKRCSNGIVMSADWKVWGAAVPAVTVKPFFAHLRSEMGAESAALQRRGLATTIARLPEPEAVAAIAGVLRDAVRRVLRIPEDRMDNLIGLQHLGLDSLMAVELANQVGLELGVPLNVMKLLRGPSVDELAAILLPDIVAAGQPDDGDGLGPMDPADIDRLPDEQVDALLSRFTGAS